MRTKFSRRRAICPGVFVVLFASLAVGAHAQSASEPLTPAQIAAACAIPPVLEVTRVGGLRVVGGQSVESRTLFTTQDLLIINGGSQAGLQLGQQFFVRRPVVFGRRTPSRPRGVHTSGWIRIVSLNDTTAIASVDFACSDIAAGDYLDPFVAPVLPDGADRVNAAGDPDFDVPGRVLYGTDEAWTGAPGDFMVIDRGSDQGVMPGARLAIYRDLEVDGLPVVAIGEATVIATARVTSTIRIMLARDSIRNGDIVFPRKP